VVRWLVRMGEREKDVRCIKSCIGVGVLTATAYLGRSFCSSEAEQIGCPAAGRPDFLDPTVRCEIGAGRLGRRGVALAGEDGVRRRQCIYIYTSQSSQEDSFAKKKKKKK
jgi:hypothetical protein